MDDETTLLIKLYELNEKYHDEKDSRAWIATTLYLTYGIVLLSWFIDKKDVTEYGFLSILLHLFISVCAFIYVKFQFDMKSFSLKYESTLQRELKRLTNIDISQLKNRKNKIPVSMDRSPIILILLLFFIVNILIIIRTILKKPTINFSTFDLFLMLIAITVILFLILLINILTIKYCNTKHLNLKKKLTISDLLNRDRMS